MFFFINHTLAFTVHFIGVIHANWVSNFITLIVGSWKVEPKYELVFG